MVNKCKPLWVLNAFQPYFPACYTQIPSQTLLRPQKVLTNEREFSKTPKCKRINERKRQTVISPPRLKTNSTSVFPLFKQKCANCSSKLGFCARQSMLQFWRVFSTADDDEDDCSVISSFNTKQIFQILSIKMNRIIVCFK